MAVLQYQCATHMQPHSSKNDGQQIIKTLKLNEWQILKYDGNEPVY